MRAPLILLLLIFPQMGFALSDSEYCRTVPSESNTLHGMVKIRTFPDQPEKVKVLVLTTPLCVVVSGFGVKTVQEVQLIDSTSKVKDVQNKEIGLKGDLFKRETERHHTLILLNVVEVLNAL